MTAAFTGGRIDLDGEEPSDEIYFQQGGYGMNDGGTRRVMKWSLTTAADITPGGPVRGAAYGPQGFKLNVFARGTCIADYDWIPETGGENPTAAHWSKTEKEFVDMLCFQVVQVSTGAVIAMWSVPGDLFTNGTMSQVTNALFNMDIRGGWLSASPLIQTATNWDPLFALMVAYLCAFEYSPSAIKKDLVSDFPSDPNGYPGWG